VPDVQNLPQKPIPSEPINMDQRLVERTLAGDLTAFEVLVQRHQDIVFRMASRIVGSDTAEDVSQDAFLRAFHRLDRFRGDASFRTWLLQITQNAALSSLKRRKIDPSGELDTEDAEDPDAARQPVTELERRERQERLSLKLELLRTDYRSLLVLRDLEGLSYSEIAEILDMPLGSVKGRLHRARDELIELLRNNTYDWELPK
jgi:RNA polymerase sigma-70 factor (ECF subfamily)